jgi:hypothetical protein
MRKVKNIFEPRASRILRCLLTNPGEAWSIRGLAKEAQVSVGYTHAVTASLLDLGYVIRNEVNLIEATDPVKLLERWASYHQFFHENKLLECYTFEREIERIIEKTRSLESDHALTTLAGAYLVSPYVRPTVVDLYVRDEGQSRSIMEKLDLKPTPRDGNVRMVLPYDEGVFYKTRKVDDVSIVSNVQLYVDLINYPARGEEAAQAILSTIRSEWSSSLLGGQ